VEQRVLDHVDRDAGVSMGQVAEELKVSHKVIWRALHEQLLDPYHLRVQVLMPTYFRARENFVCFVLRSADHSFVSSMLFTDEGHFGTDGMMNIHNKHLIV
jgi:uncharacterized circularly permuted ATP-grasp superfamily protein